MAGKIRIRAKAKDGVTEVKALMRHPMETGLRKDQEGNPIPAKFIEEVTVSHNDTVVMQTYWGASVSANPFLGMRFNGGAAGDTVTVTWVDNTGATGNGETKIR